MPLDTKEENKLKDKFKGAIVGGAIGDAFGMPYEGLSKEQIKQHYGKVPTKYQDSIHSRHTKGVKRGGYTDDTQLTQATIDSLLEKQDDVDVEDMGARFTELYKNKQLIGAGRSTKFALKNILKGASAYSSGLEDAYGCGAAMRISPVAMLPTSGHARDHIFYDVAGITHRNEIGFESAYILGEYIAGLTINDAFIETYISSLSNINQHFCIDPKLKKFSVSEKIANTIGYLDEPMEDLAKRVGTSGLANESVVYAMFSFAKEHNNFEKLLVQSVEQGGDTDSIASMAATLYGAHNGFSKLPNKYVINLQNTHEIQDKADQYSELVIRYKHMVT